MTALSDCHERSTLAIVPNSTLRENDMSEFSDSQRTIYLSRSERRAGGRLFLRFSGYNGLGISFLGDATVTLLAIYFGAGNMELGLISAMMYISGIVLLVVPRIFKGKNVVIVGFWAWICRGIVCLPLCLSSLSSRENGCYPYHDGLCSFLPVANGGCFHGKHRPKTPDDQPNAERLNFPEFIFFPGYIHSLAINQLRDSFHQANR